MIVLDTHALLWWALDPDKLSKKAATALATMERQGGFASSISVWELGIKVARQKIEMPLPIVEFTRRIERSGVVELLPVDTAIWLRSIALRWDHRDPADRVIVATAQSKGLPIVTKDDEIHAFTGVKCIW